MMRFSESPNGPLIHFVAAALLASATAFSAQTAVPPSSGAELAQHRKNAQTYLEQKHPELAIPELRAIVKAAPGDVTSTANLGVLLYFQHQYAEAVPLLRSVVAAKHDLWKIQALLGLAELRVSEIAKGRENLTAALPHLSEARLETEVRLDLSGSYLESGELERAASALEPLTTADPPNPRALYMSYRIYADLADRSLLTLAMVEPNGAAIHQAMGRDLARQAKNDTALADYREAIQADKNFPGLLTEYGILLYSSPGEENQKLAAEQFKAALEVNPNDGKAELMLGVLAWTRDDIEGAYNHDLHALQLTPDDPDTCIEMAKVLISRHDKKKAEELLLHAIQVDPTNYVAHFRLSQLYRQTGRPQDAKSENDLYQKYKKAGEKLEGILHTMQSPTAKSRENGPM